MSKFIKSLKKTGDSKGNSYKSIPLEDEDKQKRKEVEKEKDKPALLQITDLDKFFTNVYTYFYQKGYKNILIRSILDILTSILIIVFIFSIFFVNWFDLIEECKESKENDCQLVDFLIKNTHFSIKPNETSQKSLYLLKFIFYIHVLYIIITLYKYISYISEMKSIRDIYKNKLGIKQKELENLTFNHIINKLISLQDTENYCRVKEKLTKYDIISRIMRRKNYLNYLISNKIIVLPNTFKTNYTIDIITSSIINHSFQSDSALISKDFKSLTVKASLLSHFLFEIIFLFPNITFRISTWLFRNAETFSGKMIKTSTSTSSVLSDQSYSPFQLISFLCYNELNDRFDLRITSGLSHTKAFTSSFEMEFSSIVFSFLRFVCGGLLLIIILISLIDDSMLNRMKILNFNLLYIAIMIGFLSGMSSSYILPESINSTKQYVSAPLDKKINTYKNMIDQLINVSETLVNLDEFSEKNVKIQKTFSYSILLFINEILSIICLPYIIYRLYSQSEFIVNHINESTMRIDGIGDVCSCSALEIDKSSLSMLVDNSNKIWSYFVSKYIVSGLGISSKSTLFNFRKQLNSVLLYYVS